MRVQFTNIYRASQMIGRSRHALLVEVAKRGMRLHEIDGRQMLRERDVERLRVELAARAEQPTQAAC